MRPRKSDEAQSYPNTQERWAYNYARAGFEYLEEDWPTQSEVSREDEAPDTGSTPTRSTSETAAPDGSPGEGK
jgi:hypothetical protein